MASDAAIAQWRTARRQLRAARRDVDAPDPRPEQRRRGLGLAVVFAVVAVALAGIAVWQYASAPRYYSDAEFVAATTQRVRLLLQADSTDPARADRILSGATGAFADSFAQSADAYTQFVTSAKSTGDGSIDGVGLARREGESALMLVAASVRVSTDTGRDDAPAAFRMRVLMTPEDDVLKIAAMEVLR